MVYLFILNACTVPYKAFQLNTVSKIFHSTNIVLFHHPVGITLAFTKPLYQVKENGGPAQPVLQLSGAVDCCSTISVWVNIKDMTAKSMYIHNLKYIMFQSPHSFYGYG